MNTEMEKFHSYLIEKGYSINSARNMTLDIRQLFRARAQPCGIASYTNFLAEALFSSYPTFEGTVIAEKLAKRHPNGLLKITETFEHNEDYPRQVLAEVKVSVPDIVYIQHELETRVA